MTSIPFDSLFYLPLTTLVSKLRLRCLQSKFQHCSGSTKPIAPKKLFPHIPDDLCQSPHQSRVRLGSRGNAVHSLLLVWCKAAAALWGNDCSLQWDGNIPKMFGVKLSFFFFLRATPTAYGSSQARGRIGAASVTYTTAWGNSRSLTHWEGPGIKPASSWILVGFVSIEPQWEFPVIFFLK